MNGTILKAENIVKRFPQGGGEVEILHGISLELAAGEIVAVLGPSGAGKSTLLHVLGLMEHPSSGKLTIGGRHAEGISINERARLRNATIGFLFQFHHLLPELTVIENVMLPRQIARLADDKSLEQATQLLDTMGLRKHLQDRPATLSGGELQRVALARALANEPALVLADEPTGNLDKETGKTVLDLLWAECRWRNSAAIVVTHQEEIAGRADRWIRLRDGRIENASQGGPKG
jgi:lipoprotein-releasing system ATP-binding protein